MKKIVFLLGCIASCLSIYGQNAKMKNDNIPYRYDVYREIEGFDDYKAYHVKISDSKGLPYSYSEGNDERAKSADIFYFTSVIYGKRWNYQTFQLLFDIQQNSSTLNKNEVISFTDETTKATKYGYKITAKQNYTVRVYDEQNGNKLIKEFNVDYAPEAAWPDYPSATVGYNSVKLLEDNYRNSQQTVEGFYKKIDSKLISNTYSKAIVPELKMLISDSERRLIFYSTKVKAKDQKFDVLDSAVVYIEAGMEEIKKNEKAGIKGNHHPQNVKNLFLKAHRIYTEYNKQEYLDWFTDAELKEEYLWGMKSNLYMASFLIADYSQSNQIYSEIQAKVNVEKEEQKNNPQGIKSLFKRTPAQKALDAAIDFRPMELREIRLYDVFKTRFGY